MTIDKNFSPLMEKVFSGASYSRNDAEALVDSMIDGRMSDARIAAVLTAMRSPAMSQRELIVGAMASLAKHCPPILLDKTRHLADCSGVGRGYFPCINVGVMASVVAVAAGARVALFGTRSLSGPCGGADLLESLGIRLARNEADVRTDMKDLGICWLYASAFFPNLKHIGNVRKSLGFHTIFDVVFPLVNPVPLEGQLISVYDRSLLRVVAECLGVHGRKRALVAYAEDGTMDISVCGHTNIVRLENGIFSEEMWTPQDFGISVHEKAALRATPIDESAQMLVETLQPDAISSPVLDAVCVNAAGTLWCSGLVDTVRDGFELARATIKTGEAFAKLQQWRNAKT